MDRFLGVAALICMLSHSLISAEEQCDISKGSWVYDDDSPSYNSSKCPFIQKQFNCVANGRPDRDYFQFRWQPFDCRIQRFFERDFLTLLRGKRVMFVGDSLSNNQWQSLTCMLSEAEYKPGSDYSLSRVGEVSNFTIPSFNLSIFYHRRMFIVDLDKENGERILKLDSISEGSRWKEMDLLIFDTWHWWLHSGRKQAWDLVKEGNVTYKDGDRIVLYTKALKTWAKWVDSDVNTTKTKVFFQGVSPDHWEEGVRGSKPKTCEGEKKPNYDAETKPTSPAEMALEAVLKNMTKPVYLLDITRLSRYRPDGHPSVYGVGGHSSPDCTHWCLPGVPDTWNQLLYVALTDILRNNAIISSGTFPALFLTILYTLLFSLCY